MQIQQVNNFHNRGGVGSSRTSFQAHLPRTFGEMMNHIYKNTPDIFESKDAMRVSTMMGDGLEVAGTVFFERGRYAGIAMDEGCENIKNIFMRATLDKYRQKITSAQLREKILRRSGKH